MDSQIQRLRSIIAETRRLLHCPELFPSRALRARFIALVASESNLQFVQAVKDLLLCAAVAKLNQYNRANYTRPTYQPGSKGWENFYLNMAPGAPKDEPRIGTMPLSSFQLVPVAGMRIVGDLVKEERAFMQLLRDGSLPVAPEPAPTTKLLDLDNPERQDPNPKLILCHLTDDTFPANPYLEGLKIRLDFQNHARDAAEDFTPFIGRLETLPLPPNAPFATLNGTNIFPMITLRSWHPPTKWFELRYHTLSSSQQSQ